MAPGDYSEEVLVEKPATELFQSLGWSISNLYYEFSNGSSPEGREGEQDVFLQKRLRNALLKLNPSIPSEGIDLAINEFTRDRSKMIPVNANCELYRHLKEGISVNFTDDEGNQKAEKVQIIDWSEPSNNDFLIASQFWVAGEMHRRRCDLIGFVNGIPLLFIELKSPGVNVKHAYDDNLTDYRDTIPQVFVPNGFVILSNGSDTRIGGTFANWEYFGEWKKVLDESEKGGISLETVIRGTCSPARFLDIIENFTLLRPPGVA